MEQGEVTPDRGHNPDARIRITKTCVDGHPANEELSYAVLEGQRKALVAFLWGCHLRRPCGERMRGCRHYRSTISRSRLDDDSPGLMQGGSYLGDRLADPRIGFDLRAKKLTHDLMRPTVLFTFLEDTGVGIDEEIARIGIDEEELLLDAQCDFDAFIIRDDSHGSLDKKEDLR